MCLIISIARSEAVKPWRRIIICSGHIKWCSKIFCCMEHQNNCHLPECYSQFVCKSSKQILMPQRCSAWQLILEPTAIKLILREGNNPEKGHSSSICMIYWTHKHGVLFSVDPQTKAPGVDALTRLPHIPGVCVHLTSCVLSSPFALLLLSLLFLHPFFFTNKRWML